MGRRRADCVQVDLLAVPGRDAAADTGSRAIAAHTNREIDEILHLAEKTVKSHRATILRKLGMRDRVELVRYAIRRGLVAP